MTSFWKHATAEQKLAQVRGAIELGMSGTQCAMNCGANRKTLLNFARLHGHPFPHDGEQAMRKHTSGEVKIHAARRMQAAKRGVCLADDDSAFLFEKHENVNLFEPHPHDGKNLFDTRYSEA